MRVWSFQQVSKDIFFLKIVSFRKFIVSKLSEIEKINFMILKDNYTSEHENIKEI